MFPYHPNMNNFGGLDIRLQNVSDKFFTQSLPQVPIQDVTSYDYPGNQLPWKGSVQGAYGQQLGGHGRGVGFTDIQLLQQQHQSLQSQQQLHEVHQQLVAPQLRQQLEHSRQHQMQHEPHLQFPETSYSALLHGPDTPPSQPEPAWDTPIQEMENHIAGGGMGWSLNGASSYQGFPNDFLMGKDQRSESQLGFYADPSLYVGGGGPGFAFHPGTQHILSEQPSCGLRLPLSIHQGTPMPQTFTSENALPKDQGYSNPFAGHKIQHSGQQLMEQNRVPNSLYEINSLHHSYDPGLSQQRSWGSSEQKWDAPNQSIPQASEGKEGSRQSIPNSEQLQMQQHLINIDMGNENAGFSHYQLGNILPEEGSFKQQEDWAMPSRGMPTGHHINDSERQQFNSWPSVQVQRMHPDFKNCLQLPADVKENAWGTNILQENCHFIENTFHVADTSASTQTGPSNLQSGWQAGPTDVSDSAATMAGSNFQPYQEGFYSSATLGARQGSGFGSVPESESPLSSSFERYGHYQGSWKNHTLLNQFIVGVDPRDPSFNGDGHSSIWNPDFQQGTVEAEAMNSVPRKPGNRHDTASQQYHERLLSAGGHARHQQNQTKYIQGHFVGEHAPDFVKAMEEQPVKSASNMSVDRETSSHEKDVELEGPRIKKQREFSEVDVGVYHPRRNQPSSPLSPQNVKLRLGPPSNGSQNLQQGGTISRGKSSQVQDMDNNFPSVGKDHNIQSFSDGGGSEIEMDQESGTSVDTHHWVLQRSGMPSNFSPSITKDSTQSKVPSSLASGQMVNGEDGQLVAPTHAMCSLENGARLSPRESNHGVHFLSGAGRVQGNATNNGYSQGNFLTRFGAETLPLGNNPMKPIYDGNIREIMQDQLLVDLVMKQSGDIPQVANFPGLLTALKSSLSQQSMKSVGHQKTFPEEMDSSHSKFHGVQGDAPQVILETQINRRKPTNSGVVIGEGSTSVSRSSIGSQNFEEGDPNAQSKPPPEQSFCLDSSLQSKLQEQRRLSLFQLNGFRSSPLQDPGQRQDQNQFIYSKAVPPQTGAQLRGFSRSALEMFCPPLPIQRQSMQPQTEMGRPMNKSFEGRTHSEAWAPRIFESAVVAGGKSSETVLTTLNDQSNPGIMGKGALHHQEAADALAAMGQNGFLSESKAMQQQNSSSPDVGGQGKQQAADTLSFIHAQSPDQALRKDVVRSTNLMTMDAEARQSAGPYSGVMDNEQLLASQADTYYNPSAGGRDLALSQQLGWNQNQVVQYSGHHTPGVDYSALRDGQPTFSARTAGSILEQFSQHQFLFSKQKFHASIPIHPKKRKKPVPLLSPWHLAATQPRGQLPSISKAELMWANATNRLPEKDAGEIYNESASTAKRRLRITTQSMQQIIPPLPSVLMHGNKPVDNECVTYYFAKIALGEACRLMAGTEREAEPAQKGIDNKNLALHGQARTWGMAKDVAMTRLVERFMERVQHLDSELARLDCSTSALELKGKAHDLEKLSIVNRLAKHHGTGFFLDFSESIFVGNIPDCGPGIRRAAPQKYVIAVPMPRTLPEGIRCLSL